MTRGAVRCSAWSFDEKLCNLDSLSPSLESNKEVTGFGEDMDMGVTRLIALGNVELLAPRLKLSERNGENRLWRATAKDKKAMLVLGEEISVIRVKAEPVERSRRAWMLSGNGTDDRSGSICADVC